MVVDIVRVSVHKVQARRHFECWIKRTDSLKLYSLVSRAPFSAGPFMGRHVDLEDVWTM